MKSQVFGGLVAVMIAAASASAQEPAYARPSTWFPTRVEAQRDGVGPGAILAFRDKLSLSGEQISALARLLAMQQEQQLSHRRQMVAPGQDALALLQRERPDLATYERRMNEAAEHEAAARTISRDIVEAALQVLTPAQRSRLEAQTARGQGLHRSGAAGRLTLRYLGAAGYGWVIEQ